MVTDTKIPKGYKQTEVGVIPKDWEVKLLPEVLYFISGEAHEKFVIDDGKYILVNSKLISTEGKIKKYTNKNFCPARRGDVLMVMSDLPNGKALAKCFFVESDNLYAVNQRVCILRAKEGDPKYFFFTLNRNRYFLQFDDGVQQTHLLNNVFKKCPVVVPLKEEEQTAIATVLSNTDELIEGLEKLIEKKRAIKQGAMQELLTGKRRLPGFSGKWKVELLPNVTWFQEGPGVRTSQFTQSGVKLLNGTNIFRGKLLLNSTNRFIAESEAYGPYSHFLVDEGDIVIASSGITIDKFEEKISFVKKEYLPLCMNTSTIRFKIRNNLMDSLFLYYFLMSKRFKDQIGVQATGSAQLNFGPSHVEKVEIFLPKNKEEQTAIAKSFADMDAEIEKLESKLEKYKQIKIGMMQQLLTGKIRIYEPGNK